MYPADPARELTTNPEPSGKVEYCYRLPIEHKVRSTEYSIILSVLSIVKMTGYWLLATG